MQAAATAPSWIIDDSGDTPNALVAQYAALRDSELRFCRDLDELTQRTLQNTLIAISGPKLSKLSLHGRAHLAATVRAGATLYVRGITNGKATIGQDPLPFSSIPVTPRQTASAYTFGADQMVPQVLQHETANALIEVSGAECLPPSAEVQLSVLHLDGIRRPVIFSFRDGRGRVIYDLNSGWEGSTAPIVARLADPQIRPAEIGALMAVDQAASIAENRSAPFNLTIDDRPAHYDYFNAAAVKSLLRHIHELCPNAHTDFAWTPCYIRPPRSYIDEIKRASSGFVWHGFARHVDHARITDPEHDIALGGRAVAEIKRRFGVRLQPIMIFPFESCTPDRLTLLRKHGFLASVEEPRHASANQLTPKHLSCSMACRRDERSGFTVLYRYAASSLTRDRLLAMSAIGLPIIAYAHPDELGLKRLSFLSSRREKISPFDEILRFASSKGLPSASLEEIALGITSTLHSAV